MAEKRSLNSINEFKDIERLFIISGYKRSLRSHDWNLNLCCVIINSFETIDNIMSHDTSKQQVLRTFAPESVNFYLFESLTIHVLETH